MKLTTSLTWIGAGVGAAALLDAVTTHYYNAGRCEGQARTLTIMKENGLSADELDDILHRGTDSWSKKVCKIMDLYKGHGAA